MPTSAATEAAKSYEDSLEAAGTVGTSLADSKIGLTSSGTAKAAETEEAGLAASGAG
jgi:hypothetical protein